MKPITPSNEDEVVEHPNEKGKKPKNSKHPYES
jgi:hypothetical protein